MHAQAKPPILFTLALAALGCGADHASGVEADGHATGDGLAGQRSALLGTQVLPAQQMPVLVASPAVPAAEPNDCSDEKYNEVTEAVDPDDRRTRTVRVDCNLQLKASDRIEKRILIQGAEASGIEIDCGGAHLVRSDRYEDDPFSLIVASRQPSAPLPECEDSSPTAQCETEREGIERRAYGEWSRPSDVTIKNCIFDGGTVRVRGMGKGGEDHLKESSHNSRHARRARAAAPTGITLEHNTFHGRDWIPVYFEIGVTDSRVLDSVFNGRGVSTALYLDAESSGNEIRGNFFSMNTDREVIAIDGSSHNRILNNRFHGLDDGGIYLYRNCGERGVSRHTTPSFNEIINNVFYYRRYNGAKPAVYFGSRNGNSPGWGDYCDEDDASPYGSGRDDRDHASWNVVMQNQFYRRPVVAPPGQRLPALGVGVRTLDSTSRNNRVEHNEGELTSHVPVRPGVAGRRKAGCFVRSGWESNFVEDSERVRVFRRGRDPVCPSSSLVCNDGDLIPDAFASCELRTEPFNCRANNTNAGCSGTARCPSGYRVVAAKAACNLEYGRVSDEALDELSAARISVERPSDDEDEGMCRLGSHRLQSGAEATDIQTTGAVRYGCSEHDNNGGDCHIRGELTCVRDTDWRLPIGPVLANPFSGQP